MSFFVLDIYVFVRFFFFFRKKGKTEIYSPSHAILRPIYAAEYFWYGSDKKGSRTKKDGSARVNFIV